MTCLEDTVLWRRDQVSMSLRGVVASFLSVSSSCATLLLSEVVARNARVIAGGVNQPVKRAGASDMGGQGDCVALVLLQ